MTDRRTVLTDERLGRFPRSSDRSDGNALHHGGAGCGSVSERGQMWHFSAVTRR